LSIDFVMIYTSYEMTRDCSANQPVGWRYFVRQYVPVIRRILAHYSPDTALEPVLKTLGTPQSTLFRALEPVPERPFVAELRQNILTVIDAPAPEMELRLEQLTAALDGFTVVERQVVWLEGMIYPPPETGEMLRMAAPTVEKIRDRAAEGVRGQVDGWNTRLLADNGRVLGQAAGATRSERCLPWKTFLDVIDGRMTWRGREEMEQHVLGCWNCIDHFCRLLEVVELLRGVQPLNEEEAAPFDRLLGIAEERRGGWRKWFGA
jgi:hypothetical protein